MLKSILPYLMIIALDLLVYSEMFAQYENEGQAEKIVLENTAFRIDEARITFSTISNTPYKVKYQE